MSGMTFNLSGFKQLEQRLMSLSREDATKAGQSANRAGAAYAAKKIKAKAPVGPDAEGSKRTRTTKSGKTREEVHHKIVNSIKVKKVRTDRDGKVENAISTTAAYQASFVEFGSIHQPPNPFMRSTFEAEENAILDVMAKALAKNLLRRGV